MIDFKQNLGGLVYDGTQIPDEIMHRSKVGIALIKMLDTDYVRVQEVYALNFNGYKSKINIPEESTFYGGFSRGIIAHTIEEFSISAYYVDGTVKKFSSDTVPVAVDQSPELKVFFDGFSTAIDNDMLGIYHLDGRIIELPMFGIANKNYTPYDNGIATVRAVKNKAIIRITEITQSSLIEVVPPYFFTHRTNSFKESLTPFCPNNVKPIKNGLIFEKSKKELEYWTPEKTGTIKYGGDYWQPISNGAIISKNLGKDIEFTCRTIEGTEWKMKLEWPEKTTWLAYG